MKGKNLHKSLGGLDTPVVQISVLGSVIHISLSLEHSEFVAFLCVHVSVSPERSLGVPALERHVKLSPKRAFLLQIEVGLQELEGPFDRLLDPF